MSLGRTTPGEVVHRFGPPDERDGDATLVYRSALGGRDPSTESVTFRFTNGVLARICRSRS